LRSYKDAVSLAGHYPNLFQRLIWDSLQVEFQLLDTDLPSPLIANVNIVPRLGDRWLILRLSNGDWEIPGGTLEVGEDYLAAARRELLEEAGARLLSFELFGAWRCFSLAAKPYRPHLPWPESYRVVGVGEVELVGQPENPIDGEQVIAVEAVSLATAMKCFLSIQRPDLAELYHLASRIS
jgi:8-oxo-dGTP pyrophosphatase MutT (NUDIX family)